MTKRHRQLLSDIPFIEDENGCWLCTMREEKNGYALLTRGGKRWRAHRLSFTRCKGPIPEGLNVLHECDVRRCIRPAHLFTGTQRDNVADMDGKGRRGAARRAEHGHAVLSEEQVSYIRSSDERGVDLAKRFGVVPLTISRVRTGKTWRD